MPKNRLQERDNNLPSVEYEAILKEILTVLKKRTDLFQIESTALQMRADYVALEVTNMLRDTSFADISPFISTRGLTHVTANFLDGEALNSFRILIERIQEQLASHIKTALASTLPTKSTEPYLRELPASSASFDGDIAALHYPFKKRVKLHKRRLHLQARHKPGQSDIRLLGHKLTITINEMYAFESQLVDALCNQLEMLDDPPTAAHIERTRVVLQQRLQDEQSEQGTLKRILRKEAFGRLQKEARIRYLEHLVMATKSPTICIAHLPFYRIRQRIVTREDTNIFSNVAQAPYSSFLHFTNAETAEEQFFMASSIIQSLKQDQTDLHIFPVYCDKFYGSSELLMNRGCAHLRSVY